METATDKLIQAIADFGRATSFTAAKMFAPGGKGTDRALSAERKAAARLLSIVLGHKPTEEEVREILPG